MQHAHNECTKSNYVIYQLPNTGYILNPTLNGERLSNEQRERAELYLNEKHPEFLPNYFSYLAKDYPFSHARFSESALRTPPNSWWRSLLVSKNGKLNQNFVNFASRLMSAPATSASLERIFSTFGYVHSKLRNRLKLEKTAKLVFCNRHLRAKHAEDESESDSE